MSGEQKKKFILSKNILLKHYTVGLLINLKTSGGGGST